MPDGGIISESDIASLKTDVGALSAELKNFAEDAFKQIKAGKELSAELKEQIDKALLEKNEIVTKLDSVGARLDEAEQKIARPQTMFMGAGGPYRSPGEIFIENERVKAFCQERPSRGRVRVDMAMITTATVGATNDVLVPRDRQAGIVGLPDRRLTVRDLLTPGRTASNAIQYVRETGFTNLAAVVSEGQQKPESDVTFELVTKAVATIAHFMRASKQILEDAPALQSHIDGRLRYGVAYAEEAQLLNGDGTGINLHGIIPQATAYSAEFTPALPTMIDTLRLAHLQAELALFPSTGQVLHPTDWAKIELTKDSQGRYIFADVQGNAMPRLWGLPVVATMAMTVDKFLTGAFRLGAQIFDREDANVEVSTEDSDNFTKNLVTLRGEERLALAVYRPESFIYGDFGNIT